MPGAAATLAPVVDLALAFSGTSALAANDPIPGIDIIVQKKPGGIAITSPTGPDGTYKFRGLTPGQYDLSVQGKLVQTITVGPDASISGFVSREPNGKAKITFNGQITGSALLPFDISTSRSDINKGPQGRPG